MQSLYDKNINLEKTLKNKLEKIKKYEELTDAEKQIWKLIYYHPNLIGNRAEALDLLFCICGTAIRWKNGIIIDEIEDNYLTAHNPSTKSFEKDLYEKAWSNAFGINNSLHKISIDFMRAYAFYENCNAEYVRKNIEKLISYSVPKKYFYPIGQYSNLMTIPDNVRCDWLDLAIETCDLILLCDPNYQTPNGHFDNKKNIDIAKKIKERLNNIKND